MVQQPILRTHALLSLVCHPWMTVTIITMVAVWLLHFQVSHSPTTIVRAEEGHRDQGALLIHVLPLTRDGNPSQNPQKTPSYISLARTGSHAQPHTNHHIGEEVAMTGIE